MPLTIDVESKMKARMPIEYDKMAIRYKTKNGIYTFTSPDMWCIEKNLFFLLNRSKVKKFESQYKMRPDYLSYDEYRTTQLSHLLMYVNGIMCIEDFDMETVVIPSFDAIVEVCKDKYPSKKVKNLQEINW